MKRTINFLVSLALIVGLAQTSSARIVGSQGERDAFAVGASGYEVAIDSSGSVIPTTTGVGNLGDATHIWSSANVNTLTVNTTLSAPSGSITGANLVALTIGSSKIGALSVDSEKIVKSAVNTEKVAVNAIDTSKLLWGSVAPDSGKIPCIRGGNTKGWGVCSNSATMAGGCGNCQ
ncbi:MAG: hypothetical protein AABY75_05745 [Bacteroidota bacterium]